MNIELLKAWRDGHELLELVRAKGGRTAKLDQAVWLDYYYWMGYKPALKIAAHCRTR